MRRLIWVFTVCLVGTIGVYGSVQKLNEIKKNLTGRVA